MTRIAVPALVVMITVAAYVTAAGWNRSGTPRLVITLTERELQLPATPVRTDEDPGLQLRIEYDAPVDPIDARNWLPETRLRDLGFTMNVPAGAPQAAQTYDRVPARVAWIVFEYDGPRAREHEQRRALSEPRRFPEPMTPSRLVPVDAGVDFDTLSRRYPSGHVILRGTIGLSYLPPSAGGPLLYGRLVELVPRHVAVPLEFRSVLEGLLPSQPTGERLAPPSSMEPRYEAELAVGRLGLPYVRGVRRVN